MPTIGVVVVVRDEATQLWPPFFRRASGKELVARMTFTDPARERQGPSALGHRG